jgi:hypothetical protein
MPHRHALYTLIAIMIVGSALAIPYVIKTEDRLCRADAVMPPLGAGYRARGMEE